MKHRPYPNYKFSGVEWLGDVPEHWEVKRLRNTVMLTDKKTEADEENPMPYIGLENIESWTGRILPINLDIVPMGTANNFKSGNTLFGKLRPYLAKACNPDFDGLCSTEILVLKGITIDRQFLLYVVLSDGFIKIVDASTYGSKMPRANRDFIGNCNIPLPPLPEQHAIAAFLDRETTRMDTLVAKKRELIERLKEKRTALISRTVTRGLPPDAARAAGLPVNPPLKPSGVEWLGDVPEHWEVTTVLKMAQQIQTGPFGSQLHTSDYVEDGIPLVNPAHIISGKLVPDSLCSVGKETSSRLNKYHLQTGDIIMGRRGEIGRCAVVSNCESGWLCGTGSLIIRFWEGEPSFFYYIFSATGFNKLLELHAVGSTMLNINPSLIGRMLIPLPPLPEQQAIAAYLDTETAKIDALVAKIEEAIERLQEYRTALITAAVTGKVDVRVMSGVASDGKRGRG